MTRKKELFTLVLLAFASIVWTMKAVLEYRSYTTFSLILSIICAITWIVSFFIHLRRYHSGNDF